MMDQGTGDVEIQPFKVVGKDTSQLLTVAVLPDGKAKTIAKAGVKAVNSWNLKKNIRAMAFDTTVTNSGHINGVYVRIQRSLKQLMLPCPCRRHFHEVLLCADYQTCSGEISQGPEIALFTDLKKKKKWKKIDKRNFITGFDDPEIQDFVAEHGLVILKALNKNVRDYQPRDDYKEIIDLD